MEYEVWHDENKNHGYCHGILFVPVEQRAGIIAALKLIRENFGVPGAPCVKFKKSFKQPKLGRWVSANLSLFTALIKTRVTSPVSIFKEFHGALPFGLSPIITLSSLYGCRFGFLRVPDNLQGLFGQNYSEKVETTFRFILKACGHAMFSNANPIEIVEFHFDGHEHHNGGINLDRILNGSFRDYCRIAPNMRLDDTQLKERDDESRLMMCFVDNLVGAWDSVISAREDPHNVLSPLSDIYDRLVERKIFQNINSEWFKSIIVSEMNITNGNIEFTDVYTNPQDTLF